jgi:hypothetical protein
MAAKDREVYNFAKDQAMGIREGIGETAWAALEEVERQKVTDIFRGWVYLDGAWAPFVSFERVGKDLVVRASRMAWSEKKRCYTQIFQDVVTSDGAVIWRTPPAGQE